MDRDELHRQIDRVLDALAGGDDVQALALADQLTAAVPDNALARAMRAQAVLSTGDGGEALSEARRAVELDPESHYAHRLLGLAAWRLDRLSLAQQALERAIELSDQRPELLADYAWFMATRRGPRPAEEAAQRAVDADRESATAWAALGLSQYRRHQRQDAEASLRRALQLNSENIYAQNAMVILLQDRRKDSQAEMLGESPGTEEFVEAVHDEAKRRQIAKMLVERNALPDVPDVMPPRRRAALILGVAILAAVLCGLFLAEGPIVVGVAVCVVLPLLALWYLRGVFE